MLRIQKLPSDNLVNNLLLLRCGSSKVDSCCFYALVPHKVGKEGDVVVFLQEVPQCSFGPGCCKLSDLFFIPKPIFYQVY